MPKNKDIKKVLVIGSGPIIIGQAAEFDYAGTQACRALKEEGIEVVLINSNPATIMTDKDIADHVYIEPLTVPVVKNLILKEKPDSILPTLGGQNALNIAMALADEGFLEAHNVRTIGTDTTTIKLAEDRLEFKELMERIHEPVAASTVVNHVDDALEFAEKIGYPVVVRPAYTLGGTGGGIAETPEELHDICTNGLRLSRVSQCLIERCIAGWKEIEYEVMRDGNGNCITVCNMENVDPVGVHTGDSIVVAPSQTLGDKEYQMLRSSALNIITALNIKGGCNVQFALNPNTFEYCVIEVNPRVSRSSALASKATGYPIAKLAAKIALGYSLDEIVNAVTGKTYASYEPTLDYIVCKIPKWPFDKFYGASRKLGTQMKATGEVMAICNNFEGALMKALRSLEQNVFYLSIPEMEGKDTEYLRTKLKDVDDQRIFAVAEALRQGITEEEIHNITKIDLWFIDKIKHLVEIENKLKTEELTPELLKAAKRVEFPDRVIADLTGKDKNEIHDYRLENNITAAFKTVDTCAAEFDAETPYFYSVYGGEHEIKPDNTRKKVMVLGSGPIRIGQGIEFDYCSVHCVWELRAAGYETIIVNNNPETVSTDFDIADRLYFEPLTQEDVQSIVELEKPDGAIVQFGGQTAIKLTQDLMDMGVPILGTSADSVDAAEDRERFDEVLEKCEIDRPRGATVFTVDEALEVANKLGYPVLVRPSYVLGGAGMEIALNDGDIKKFMKIINRQFQEHPILIDKYLSGKEVEVDAVCDENGVLIPGVMEHVERAGVHSGDSISVYPPQKIKPEIKEVICDYTQRLAKALHVIGLINIQFIVYEDEVYVIEVNPRSSRTIPYISKVTDIPVVDVATKVIMGHSIKDQGYEYGLQPEKETVAVKMPVFSFEKIKGAEISLGPEMKSTGEVLGIAKTFDEAIYKAFIGTGINLPKRKNIICTIKDSSKEEFLPIAKQFYMFGYDLYSTEGTYNFLKEHDVPVHRVNRIAEKSNTIFDLMLTDTVDLVIDIPTRNDNLKDGFLIRRFAVEAGIPIYTSLDTAQALINCLEKRHQGPTSLVDITKLK